MLEQDVRYLKYKTYLSFYCPHCNNTFNVERAHEKSLIFNATWKDKNLVLKLSPFLDVFDIKTSIEMTEGEILDDLLCPHCKESIVDPEVKCGECGSKVGMAIVSAFAKLIPFYFCLKKGCEWHGITKEDEKKIKLKIPRQSMPEQDQKLRISNFKEVPYGYTTELALLEAGRCLQCKRPKCVEGCPVNIDIPAFIELITQEKFIDAVHKIKETNVFPAICGRVCPQEAQCEALCVLGKRDEPVAIGRLERFVADYEQKMDQVDIPVIKKNTGKKIAVVGSGPGGLTVAADMKKLGYEVTIFEALHESGGVLTYGIPEFRLPKAIVHSEIDYLKKLGVRVELNHIIGNILTVDELLEHFDAVYIGVGAGLPWFMNIEGESLGNVFSANEYLTRMNLMKAYKFPEYDTPMPEGSKIAVIGGGNVAMDCARTALRAGSSEVTIIYRRSRHELPARIEEVHHAEEEGVQFKLLTSPVRYIGSDYSVIKAMECIRMKLGEPDATGRRRPIPIEGSEFTIDCDMAIVAIGNGPNPVIFHSTPDMELNKRGYIKVNEDTMETTKEFVYAGGDIVTGAATVILAMGAGRTAAKAMHKKLTELDKKAKAPQKKSMKVK